MNDEHENEFDDPGFKAAIRRSVRRDAAPSGLRAKVTSLLASEIAGASAPAAPAESSRTSLESSPAPRPKRWGIDRKFWRVPGLAACVLLALGWMGLAIRSEFFPSSPSVVGSGSYTAIPASVVLEVLRAHDNCAKLTDHHLIPGDHPEALRDKLSAEGGITASSVSLGGEWQFKGAGVCTVGDKKAAHLLFVRRDEYVSIFSMFAPAGCGHGTASYKDTVESHPVAGFTRGEALYWVVGSCASGTLTMTELDPVLQRVQASVASGCLAPETIAAAVNAGSSRHHR